MGLPALAPVETEEAKPALFIGQPAIGKSPPTTSHQPSSRIPALDGLRGIAILLVLLRHSVAGTPTESKFWSAVLHPLKLTWSGVDLFFVLSGFLIGSILLNVRCSPRYFQTFYIRRAFRILPVYYIFVLIYFARHLHIPFLPSVLADASPLPVPFLAFVTFTHNFWMATFGWFGAWGIAPTWSPAIEEQFYLAIPFLVRRISVRLLYLVLGCVIVGAPILRAILPHIMRHGAFASFVLMPCRADALSMGVVAALIYRNRESKQWICRHPWVLHSNLCDA
jgi:peptidoglycan/LPS O-acetylase OafA/YrhL